jgi:hypothetical protein
VDGVAGRPAGPEAGERRGGAEDLEEAAPREGLRGLGRASRELGRVRAAALALGQAPPALPAVRRRLALPRTQDVQCALA